MAPDFEAVSDWIAETARPLDRAMFDLRMGSGSADAIWNALAAFQNEDGGFGHGIEPDKGLPDSRALASSIAFQYLADTGAHVNDQVVQRALGYLKSTLDSERSGWAIVVPAIDDYPHAPWWGYDGAMAGFGWGNPSAELLGYLIQFDQSTSLAIIDAVSTR